MWQVNLSFTCASFIWFSFFIAVVGGHFLRMMIYLNKFCILKQVDFCCCQNNWKSNSDTQATLPSFGSAHICVEAWPLCWLLLFEYSSWETLGWTGLLENSRVGYFQRYHRPKYFPQSEKIHWITSHIVLP